MKLQKLNQKGIAHILPVVVIILILIIGFAAYRVINKQQDEQPQEVASTEQAPAETEEKAMPEKTVYSFENTPLQVDLPDGWEAQIDKRYDQTGDGTKESYNGTINGTGGWAITFTIDQGGLGGGPGCNFNNEQPDLPKCPYYEVVSKQKLETGDYLYHQSLSRPGGIESLPAHCVIVASDNEFSADKKTGTVFEASGWVCAPSMGIKGSTVENGLPGSGRFSIEFPNDLEQTTSTAYREEAGFKEAMEILGSLRYR